MNVLKHEDHHFTDQDHHDVYQEKLHYSVYRENEHHVELALRVQGLLPRKGLWFRIKNHFATHRSPHELIGNGEIKRWEATNNSLDLAIQLINKKGVPYVLYSAKLTELPSPVDSKSITVKVRKLKDQCKSFVIIRLNKQAPALIWMAFAREHGTLDAAVAKEEAEKTKHEEDECNVESDKERLNWQNVARA